jgi:hypothetical protein
LAVEPYFGFRRPSASTTGRQSTANTLLWYLLRDCGPKERR